MFLLLGVLFLDHLLKLVQFLAQLREGLLRGTGFLSAFLSGAEIGFLRSFFLKTTTIARIVVPPCLLQGRRVSQYELSGTVVSTRLLRTFFYRCAKVSRRKKRRTFWILPGYISRCTRVSCCEMRWTYHIFPGHTRARQSRETEGANACLQESHVSCEGRTDPATCTGTLVT